ncbi:MAG: aspartate/glutamate racemase family protein, partial [Ruminiclostridium sp.]|nr:aspartate/glutamate racemase family protein [Ruminiclostridium sp.]
TLIDELVKAGRELETEGVRAIVGACGYFAYFQPQLAAILDVPVYLSSLIQVPYIKTGLKPHQKIGVLCADKVSLTHQVMKNAGIDDPDLCVVSGLEDMPEFSGILKSDRGYFNNEIVRDEVVSSAKALVEENPDIGAILLECSDMPPYAADVQRAVNLPVFDFITMINWVHGAVAQRQYYGDL